MPQHEIDRATLDKITDPDFENTNKVHDWRNHVLPNTQEIWQSLSLFQRYAVYLDAESRAMDEEWD